MTLGIARLSYLVAVGFLAVGYYLVPGQRPAATAFIGLATAATIALRVGQLRPPRWGGWALIGAAVASATAGEVSDACALDDHAGASSFPATPDLFYLLTFPLLALGLIALGRRARPSRNTSMLLDVTGLSLAGSLLVWITVVRPALMDNALSTAGRVVALASWVGVVLVLAAGARVLLAWHRAPALRWLGLGVAAFLATVSLHAAAVLAGTAGVAGPIVVPFHAFALCCGLAALSPSMVLVDRNDHPYRGARPARTAALTFSVLIAPTVLLVEATAGPVTAGPVTAGPVTAGVAIALVAAGVGIVAVVRLAHSVNAHRERTQRERAIGIALRGLVSAMTETGVMAIVRAALRMMLPAGVPHDVILTTGPAHRTLTLTHQRARSAEGELTVPLARDLSATGGPAGSGAERALRFSAPVERLVELAPALEAITDQAALALARIGLAARLRADERERYFRTLVLTSTDATLISRGGRIDYATPSAEQLFGRDVRGESVESVITTIEPGADGVALGTAPPSGADGWEGSVHRPDGSVVTVKVRQHDLSADPTIAGIVTTARDVTAERLLQRDLAYRASHDPLTGLANAEAFQNRIATMERRGPEGFRRAALFVDLDDFKMINDTYGHELGDRLLEVVARRIESCLRAGDVAARLGGDEFAVLLDAVRDEEAARAVAQRLSDTLAVPAIIDGVRLSCQASIGLAYGVASSTTLLRAADAALYTAKERGKGRWSQYRPGMTAPTRQHLLARRRLEHAIESDTLTLWYQPIVALDTGAVVGFEALIRMRDGDQPMTAEEISRVADETGIVVQLGAWTLRRALRDLKDLDRTTVPTRYISVNVSPRQLNQPDFVDAVRAALRDTGVDPRRLMLEILEDPRIGDEDDRAWGFLTELRRDGVRIAIDDYGTGQATLSYLRQPAVDVVKVDKSYVLAATEPRGHTLLRHLASLCLELGLDMIAEGVSDERTRRVLIELGCRLGQGFLFARPMPLDHAAQWSARH